MNIVLIISLLFSASTIDTCYQKLLNKLTSDTSFNGYMVKTSVVYNDGKIRDAFIEYRALYYYIKDSMNLSDIETKNLCYNLLDTANIIVPVSKLLKYFSVSEPDLKNKKLRYLHNYKKFNSYYIAENEEFLLKTSTGLWYEVLNQLWDWRVGVRILFGYPTVAFRCIRLDDLYFVFSLR
jgi:hypothetical protein